MQEFLCSVLCAAIRADRNEMSQYDWVGHGIEAGPYTDGLMCFASDWQVDLSLFEDELEYASLHGAFHLRESDVWTRVSS